MDLVQVFPGSVVNSPLFSGLTKKEQDEFLKAGRTKKYLRGELLFAHGDFVDSFYIICDGTVQLFRESPEGHEKTIDILKSGQTLCESEILDACSAHRVNGVAVENTVALEFSASWLKEYAKKSSTLALNLLARISEQVHMAEIEAEHQATFSAAQLVACFLQRLCVLYDFDPKGFDLPYAKTLIASRLGMELETFSRTLGKLKSEGISVEGNHVTIYDLEKIEQYVCSACSVSHECQTHQAIEDKSNLRPAKKS